MKIVQASAYYPPHVGGQENAVQDLSEHLALAGHEVQVLTSTKGRGERGITEESGMRVWRMSGIEFGHAPIMPAFGPALFRAARRESVVHVHIGQAFVPEMVWLAARLRGFRYIAELHIDFKPSGPAGILLPLYKRLILGRVLRSAAKVVVLNKKTLHTVKRVYGVKNVAVMSNGINEAYFKLVRRQQKKRPPKQLHLLFVGRLTRQKNVEMLLRAIAQAKSTVKLDIIGDGEEREILEEITKTLQLTNIVFHGQLDRLAVLAFYERCDALVMPSLYEAQPLVLLEAMAARIPIIGTNVIGVAEHIWGVGIVVKPTAKALAEGFEALRASHASLPAMLEKGFLKAQKLRWQNLRKDYEALYEEALHE
ncbi:MAG TPA: glycosyltransferase family 4 protein [Candidatus Saccharimonadales bacterium]